MVIEETIIIPSAALEASALCSRAMPGASAGGR
jgi:hypothetical protein